MCYYVCEHRLQFVAYLFFFQAEDGIRDLVRSRGLGDVYKRQVQFAARMAKHDDVAALRHVELIGEVADDQVFAVDQLSLIHI